MKRRARELAAVAVTLAGAALMGLGQRLDPTSWPSGKTDAERQVEAWREAIDALRQSHARMTPGQLEYANAHAREWRRRWEA